MSKQEWKTIRVTTDVYACLLRSKALMELQTAKRCSMNEAIKGLLEYAPTIENLTIKDVEMQ